MTALLATLAYFLAHSRIYINEAYSFAGRRGKPSEHRQQS